MCIKRKVGINKYGLPLYKATCKYHGEFIAYPSGWSGVLQCPECLKEEVHNSEQAVY